VAEQRLGQKRGETRLTANGVINAKVSDTKQEIIDFLGVRRLRVVDVWIDERENRVAQHGEDRDQVGRDLVVQTYAAEALPQKPSSKVPLLGLKSIPMNDMTFSFFLHGNTA
jgi:hypothetical protein